MKKRTNVLWAKDGYEKSMQFNTRKEAFKAANDPVYWPNDVDHRGMMVIVTDAENGEELKVITL